MQPRTTIAPLMALLVGCALFASKISAADAPARFANAAVVSQDKIASKVGAEILGRGGNAVDAAVATAFALAVTHPAAGNIGGGGFLVFRSAQGEAVAYDFREMAPAKASATMFLRNGRYDSELHHNSHVAAGVPGTVAGLHLAWKEQGKLAWRELVQPAIALARDGLTVSDDLARSLKGTLPVLKKYPASFAQFTRDGTPYRAGETLKQPDLARTLSR
ncbi:MAG TPA: gamma-glutamyltransferase, partial [Verrucomicrobiae bacterium]